MASIEDFPYTVRYVNLSITQKYYIREGAVCSSIADLLSHNANIVPPNTNIALKETGYIFLDNLQFAWEPMGQRSVRSTGIAMNGIWALLVALPQEEVITNKTHLAMITSYFGNGAKKKIAELGTPKAIVEWAKTNPIEVLTLMGIKLPLPMEKKEEKKEEEKKPAKEPVIKIKERKIKEPEPEDLAVDLASILDHNPPTPVPYPTIR